MWKGEKEEKNSEEKKGEVNKSGKGKREKDDTRVKKRK